MSFSIVDYLGIDMFFTAEYIKSGPFGRTRDLSSDSHMALFPLRACIRSFNHFTVEYALDLHLLVITLHRFA